MNVKSQGTRPQENNAPPSGGLGLTTCLPRRRNPRTRAPAPRTLDSHALLGDQAMVQIQHLGEIYRLQSTRQGKLILTK
jgi:hemin uptake protein HemP